MIEVIGGKLFQWDTGRVARVIPSNGVTIHEVHFAAYGMKYAYVVETYEKDGAVLCAIPNAILQQDKRILCYEVTRTDTGEMSVSSTPLSLASRSKPQDYVYTEDELKNYDHLESLTEEKLATLKREFSGTVGDLKNLNTTNKSNLVAAINEAAQSGASVQSDWNQNDETAADYVKNRTHWSEPGTLTLASNCLLDDPIQEGDGLYCYLFSWPHEITVGQKYAVLFDGVEYECVSDFVDGLVFIGNLSLMGGPDSGEPFLFLGNGYIITRSNGISFSCTADVTIYHELPLSYVQNGSVLNGVILHKSNAMTIEEAQKYCMLYTLNNFFLMRWGELFFNKFYIGYKSGQPDYLDLGFHTDEYRVDLNADGVFSADDIRSVKIEIHTGNGIISGVSTGLQSSCKLLVEEGGAVTVSPHFFYGGASKEDTLFLCKKNGNTGIDFEVLGNGAIKTQSVIIASSTTNSTKKFKITVDDSGTLSATEV